MPLVGDYQEVHTARPSSHFQCARCHEPIKDKYIQHKLLHSGARGRRYSKNYRYHPDCHDAPAPVPAPAPSRPRDTSSDPGLTTPQLALIGGVVVAVILGGFALYDWWQKKKKRALPA